MNLLRALRFILRALRSSPVAHLVLAFVAVGSPAVAQIAEGLRYVPVNPCRVLDTRVSQPAILAGATRTVPVGCGLPATTKAWALNLTSCPPASPACGSPAAPGNYNAIDQGVRHRSGRMRESQQNGECLSVHGTSDAFGGHFVKFRRSALQSLKTGVKTPMNRDGNQAKSFFTCHLPLLCRAPAHHQQQAQE